MQQDVEVICVIAKILTVNIIDREVNLLLAFQTFENIKKKNSPFVKWMRRSHQIFLLSSLADRHLP